MDPRLVQISKASSYALRHAPQKFGLELDEEGFVTIDELLAGLNAKRPEHDPATHQDLEQIIAESDKQRHEIVDDKIRALYGHSTAQKIERTPTTPPAILYHGTSHKAAKIILSEGLKSMRRQNVHLSVDVETAHLVGLRRDDDPIILVVDAAAAAAAGCNFYQGNDKVWLSDAIPAEFIRVLSESEDIA